MINKNIAAILNPQELHFFKKEDSVKILNKPIYEIVLAPEKYPDINLSNYGVWPHTIKEITELNKNNLIFKNSYDFFWQTNYIQHFFIGNDQTSATPLAKVYGLNHLQWKKESASISIEQCNSTPLHEDPVIFASLKRYKGTALISIAQACYYYLKFNPPAYNEKKAITLEASHYAYAKNIYTEYGFKPEEEFLKAIADYSDHQKKHLLYPMYLTNYAVQDFITDFKDILWNKLVLGKFW